MVISAALLILPKYIFNKEKVANNGGTDQTKTTIIPTAFPLDVAMTEELKTQATKEFDFAFSKAKEWKDDALFFGVVAKYKDGISVENGKNTYIFASPSLATYYWTLTINQSKNENGEHDYERVIYYRDDYFLPATAAVVPIAYWKLNYIDALQKADDLGGKDIRAQGKKYDVNVLLSAQEGEYLAWSVEYLVDGKSVFTNSANAFNGEAAQ